MSSNKTKKISTKIKRNPRFQSLLLLEKVAQQQAYSNLLVNNQIEKSGMSSKDTGLFTEIVYGTISRQLTLDYYLVPFIKKAKKIDQWVLLLLRLSLYQMIYLDRVPTYSVINDAVEIAKNYGNEGIGKFVNGVLRNVDRQGVREIESIKDEVERMSISLSLPKWMVEKLIQDYGIEKTQAIGTSLFEKSRVSARITHPTVDTFAEVATILQEDEGIDVSQSLVSPVGIVAEKGHLAKSRLFIEGRLAIQDESSMLVAPTLKIEAHDHVLDACAAPGGKTTHIASYLDENEGGQVIALDIHQHKLKLIEENAKRVNVEKRVEPMLLDARQASVTFENDSFDRILVDAPCSGLGLMRRKPDIRYTKQPEDFLKLQKIQLEILESVATKVKLYGIITYSTCTFSIEENEQVIEQFLSKHKEFEIIVPEGTAHLEKSIRAEGIKLLPSDYGTDGFFICSMQRIS